MTCHAGQAGTWAGHNQQAELAALGFQQPDPLHLLCPGKGSPAAHRGVQNPSGCTQSPLAESPDTL